MIPEAIYYIIATVAGLGGGALIYLGTIKVLKKYFPKFYSKQFELESEKVEEFTNNEDLYRDMKSQPLS